MNPNIIPTYTTPPQKDSTKSFFFISELLTIKLLYFGRRTMSEDIVEITFKYANGKLFTLKKNGIISTFATETWSMIGNYDESGHDITNENSITFELGTVNLKSNDFMMYRGTTSVMFSATVESLQILRLHPSVVGMVRVPLPLVVDYICSSSSTPGEPDVPAVSASDTVQCPVCLEEFTKDAINRFPCHHTICFGCIRKMPPCFSTCVRRGFTVFKHHNVDTTKNIDTGEDVTNAYFCHRIRCPCCLRNYFLEAPLLIEGNIEEFDLAMAIHNAKVYSNVNGIVLWPHTLTNEEGV